MIDLDRILESECEDAFEDARDHLKGVDELQKAVNAFNDLNADVLSFCVDLKHKTRLREVAA